MCEAKLDLIRADTTAHQARLVRLLPGLIEEFGERRSPEEIRSCADAILARYDDVPIRSFALELARRYARECLRRDVCDAVAVS